MTRQQVDVTGGVGTGSYRAGLTRFLTAAQIELIEVDRPDRRTRRRQGKSDPIVAVAAARAALEGTRTGTPKRRDSRVETLRNLRVPAASSATSTREVHALLTNPVEPTQHPLDIHRSILLAVFASGERVEELERRAVPADQMTMPIRAAVGRAS
jgi:transposase